ncbi:unnamed protein product [Brachionus calyciflorus]|uniref:Uncharacterized protein n=1 Tax=Brachionus calyciflorus TaxID=104777 RepID=A0A813Z1C2_9BILA|nr:unnamed protein product [Brachionus calyciflorus]
MDSTQFCSKLIQKYPNLNTNKPLKDKIIKENVIDLKDTTIVGKPITNKEEYSILEKLNTVKSLREDQNFAPSFRLDNPQNKGSGHWEIQRNGEKGKTTVAQVHAPGWAQEFLNFLQNSDLQNKYDKLLCNKLINSLTSGRNEITKAYVTLKDLESVFF